MIMADGRLSRPNQVAGITYTFYPTLNPKKLKALAVDAVWRVCLTTVSIGYEMRT
jgi:hypothetical protein